MMDVEISLCGGIGNQMFQYAAARALATQYKADVIIDLSWFSYNQNVKGVTARTYALHSFNLDVKIVGLPNSTNPFILFLKRNKDKFSRLIPIDVTKNDVFREKKFEFNKDFFNKKPPIKLIGYFQSYRYFEKISNNIRYEFGVPKGLSPKSEKMLERISRTCAIAVHVRRGDYVTNDAANKFHGLCGLDYYLKGVELINSTDGNGECFVFSDDPDWVRENMRLPIATTIVDINGPEEAHQDLWLMAACRHFIIANSSLSWWAAWLGGHPSKRVVAPLMWFKNSLNDTSDLIPPEWMRV